MPSSANFGSVNIGTASTAQTLTYTFAAQATLGSMAVVTQGAAGLDLPMQAREPVRPILYTPSTNPAR